MIKFFRKIRHKLLSRNKFSKYLIYAVGEIILVVIGILIALQINNWNEANKQQRKSENLTIRLQNQISQNIQQTKNRIDYIKIQMDNMTSLMHMIGKPFEEFDFELLDKKMSMLLIDYHLGLDMNTLSEAQDNGEIASLKNDSLRVALYKLTTINETLEQRETVANGDNLNFVVPYFYKNSNGRNIASNNDSNYRKKIGYSKLHNHNYNDILNDREFENLLDYRIYYSQEILDRYNYLQEYLEYIKILLDK
ncbi:DUF6090 family protein [Hanstruepera ponticola]|uniref:DUF6090 family protein n=1 Tax=Hanstruepera ponticola TaxID=2042995 RepID=UPI000CF08B87|nr:DUF6090 family protein [Hanstruepera ponticola]